MVEEDHASIQKYHSAPSVGDVIDIYRPLCPDINIMAYQR